MSKRLLYPEHQGDRKRTKLDISISDHNFPLSQNNELSKDATWGDDNDDEILLLASQACEQAYSQPVNESLLPNYSLFMQPGSTSTQLNPVPSTSKTEFTFKKPSVHPSSIISTQLKERCNRISSPLPGISSKMSPKSNGNDELTDEDFMFSDKIFKGQDSDHTYRQLLQLQEENAKLKSENCKLLEKCVTKEGEASILRTQLKTCQMSVDNARLEKIKAQEKVQMEFSDKLTVANNQMSDLRTQLDFKNLEIISVKEKCKKLESTKVRLTQVTVANNDISSSQRRQSNSFHNESITQSKRVKLASSAVQTENKAKYMVLSKTIFKESASLPPLLPPLLCSCPSPPSPLDYNETLSRGAPQKCRVYSTFHRIPSTPKIKEKTNRFQLSSLYEDLTSIASGNGNKDNYFNVFDATKSVLSEVHSTLEAISQRMSSAFQKEMDEKYLEASSTYLDVSTEDLLKGRILYKDEQAITARRLVAMLGHIVRTKEGADMFHSHLQHADHLLVCVNRVCAAQDNASCATLYSGLLLSIAFLVESSPPDDLTLSITRALVAARALPCVVGAVVGLVGRWGERGRWCVGSSGGNLRTDYDQGVLLFKKDSCYLQILLKQVETCLKCIENQQLVVKAIDTTRQLIKLYNNISSDTSLVQDKSRCECQLVLVQVIVYALKICSVMLDRQKNKENGLSVPLLSVCRCGIQLLYANVRECELSRLSQSEGHLIHFTEVMNTQHSEVYANMLSELAGTLQSSPEDMPPSFHRQPWIKSFDQFSISD